MPITSSDDKKSLLGFLEESKEQNDNIANFLICQYKALFGNIMNESIVDLKSDLYSKVKDIFDNPKKRKEFKSILEQLNEINGQWDRRGDCIFSYFIEKWKNNKNWNNADLAGYPNILQRRSKKGITVYLQGGYGSQIQIGVYNKGCFKEKRSIENKFNNKLPSSEYPLKWAGANKWCYTFIDVDRFKDFEDAKKQISGITEYLVQNC